MRAALSAILALTLVALCGVPASATDAEFDAMWHDGRAELNGYRLEVSRYGQKRTGHAVLVYVTEPFSESKRVKVDDHTKNPDDTFNALKLNLIRDFQTGIYDYNTMVSVFVRASDFSPVKISFSSAEWCGHVYEELLFYPDEVKGHYYSYFENESGPRKLRRDPEGIAEDNLFVLLRGLRNDYLAPGQEKDVRLLPSVYFGRLAHDDPTWVSATIAREEGSRQLTTPAGAFTVSVYNVRTSGGREGIFFIEEEYPHRIVRWEMLPDIRADLTGSSRLAYWKLNQNGHERYLAELGLE
jgi:hypothetical protein